jgi:hypothetical protein
MNLLRGADGAFLHLTLFKWQNGKESIKIGPPANIANNGWRVDGIYLIASKVYGCNGSNA